MGFSSAMDSAASAYRKRQWAYRRRLIIERLSGAAVLAVLVGGFGYLVSYYTGYDTYHECRVAMAEEQYRNGPPWRVLLSVLDEWALGFLWDA